MKDVMKRFIKDEKGLETVEYAIIGALITIAAIGTIISIGSEVSDKFDELLSALQQ